MGAGEETPWRRAAVSAAPVGTPPMWKGIVMPKYMFNADFTPQGVQGVLAQGGSARRAAVDKTVSNLGGTVEAYYFTFGAKDVVVIADLPDNTSAAAFSMAVGASGFCSVTTTPLLTCEEIDATARIAVDWSPPGQ